VSRRKNLKIYLSKIKTTFVEFVGSKKSLVRNMGGCIGRVNNANRYRKG
jgi:hypothetical protein